MNLQTISGLSCAVLLTVANAASAGQMSFSILKLNAPHRAQAELVHFRCHGYYGWFPDGTIAGATGGYPYYGWFGYPYVPYRCVRLRHRRDGWYSHSDGRVARPLS